MLLRQPVDQLQEDYQGLMAMRRGDPVEETLARMLASWLAGHGDMPVHLGLDDLPFSRMLAHHFPGYPVGVFAGPGKVLDPNRIDESDDLHRLLLKSRSGKSESELWMVDIVVAGCQGNDHLWQDLGLWNRADLSRLMLDNFAPLARRNDRDMKWKKFLYKQLCETEGIYTCRSPSCEVCTDFAVCFGPEE